MNQDQRDEVKELVSDYDKLILSEKVTENAHELFISITKQAKSRKGISERQLEVIRSIVRNAKKKL